MRVAIRVGVAVFFVALVIMHLMVAFVAWDLWWFTRMGSWANEARAMYLMVSLLIPGSLALGAWGMALEL